MYSKRDRIGLDKWHISYFNAPDGRYVRATGGWFLSVWIHVGAVVVGKPNFWQRVEEIQCVQLKLRRIPRKSSLEKKMLETKSINMVER